MANLCISTCSEDHIYNFVFNDRIPTDLETDNNLQR